MVETILANTPRREPLAELLDAAGVGRASRILVTGPGGLPALLWFCRHGYEQAGYVASNQARPCEDADALIVAHTCDAAWLEGLLAHGPHVREGGVLIVRSPSPPAQGRDPVHAALARHGLAVERCVRGARRELHVARRLAALRRAA